MIEHNRLPASIVRMMRRRRFLGTLTGVVLGAALVHPAMALMIDINAGANLMANGDALAAFNRAASRWESVFVDPVTVRIDADLISIADPDVIGQTSSELLTGGFDFIRNQIVLDASDEPGDTIVASLPTARKFSAFVPAGFTLSPKITLTRANAKALGFSGLPGGPADASIDFNSGFNFDFDPGDGIAAGLVDFETVAAHEIGHALGFVSAVDTIDFLLSNNQTAAISVRPFDLYRFANDTAGDPASAADFTTAKRSLTPSGDPIFDDTTSEFRLSSGFFNGDGRQASHFKDDALTGVLLGVMDPTLSAGRSISISPADVRVLDLIGWDVSVPEPGGTVLMLAGLLALGLTRARRVAQG